MSYDVIVIGLGGMGSATAAQLAARGARVLGLERFPIGHEQGSSHGFTRIIRLAYFEHPSYVPLLERSYELWESLERESGDSLLHITGSIDAGEPNSRTVTGSRHSCEVHGLAHEVLTSSELARRFPGYSLPDEHLAVWQPRGGFLVPERCIAAHVQRAARHGADVRAEERVLGWEPIGDHVAVTTDRGRYEAGHLVVAAGSWSGTLLPSLREWLVPERQVLAWFDIADRDHFAPARFPVFNLDLDGTHWYGFPEFGVPGFKIGCYHHLREVVDPDLLDRSRVTTEDVELLRSVVARCFPAVGREALLTKTCLFTNTPDEHFVLDRLPEVPQVVIAHACSGHGFKFCAVIGEIVADLTLDGDTRHDISLHRVARLSAGR